MLTKNSFKRLLLSSFSVLSFATIPLTLFSSHQAHAQYYFSTQPNMGTSLGNALGAGLSGNYTGGSTSVYNPGFNAAYETAILNRYGGVDQVGRFYNQDYSFTTPKPDSDNTKKDDSNKDDSNKDDASKAKKDDDAANKTTQEQLLDMAKQREKKPETDDTKKTDAKSNSPFLDPSKPLSVSGTAHVLDGVSMNVKGVLVILHGVRAPGNGQMCNAIGVQYACGDKARENLSDLVEGKPISCSGWGNEAVCISDIDGTNINNAVLGQGIAKPE